MMDNLSCQQPGSGQPGLNMLKKPRRNTELENKHFYSQVKLKRLKFGKLVTKILTESLQESPSHCTNSTVSPAWASPPPQRWSLAPVQSYCKFLSFWKACSFICCSYPPLISDLCSLSDGLFLIDQNLCLFLYCCSSFQRPCCRMDWN